MVNSLAASQAVSMVASQQDTDPAARAQKANQGAESVSAGLFLKVLESSMDMVQDLVEIQQEDPLRDEEDENQSEE